jgi:hypothetical protein
MPRKSARRSSGPKRAAATGYSGTPLPQKLGIRAGMRVVVTGAPPGFAELLGPLPEGARVDHGGRGERGLTICFVTARKALERALPADALQRFDGGLWVAWPKKASGVATDLDEHVLRAVLLPRGLVDHKVCAIDATWSGLRFAPRRS